MTATDLKKRAIALAEKTKIDSVTPEEVGQLSNDIVEYIENVEINGSSLGIRKTYTSVSAMEADSTAPKDDKGVLLRRGMLVNIYNQSDQDSADNGKVFSFQNPGWAFRGTVDAGYATKEELTELERYSNALRISATATSTFGEIASKTVFIQKGSRIKIKCSVSQKSTTRLYGNVIGTGTYLLFSADEPGDSEKDLVVDRDVHKLFLYSEKEGNTVELTISTDYVADLTPKVENNTANISKIQSEVAKFSERPIFSNFFEIKAEGKSKLTRVDTTTVFIKKKMRLKISCDQNSGRVIIYPNSDGGVKALFDTAKGFEQSVDVSEDIYKLFTYSANFSDLVTFTIKVLVEVEKNEELNQKIEELQTDIGEIRYKIGFPFETFVKGISHKGNGLNEVYSFDTRFENETIKLILNNFSTFDDVSRVLVFVGSVRKELTRFDDGYFEGEFVCEGEIGTSIVIFVTDTASGTFDIQISELGGNDSILRRIEKLEEDSVESIPISISPYYNLKGVCMGDSHAQNRDKWAPRIFEKIGAIYDSETTDIVVGGANSLGEGYEGYCDPFYAQAVRAVEQYKEGKQIDIAVVENVHYVDDGDINEAFPFLVRQVVDGGEQEVQIRDSDTWFTENLSTVLPDSKKKLGTIFYAKFKNTKYNLTFSGTPKNGTFKLTIDGHDFVAEASEGENINDFVNKLGIWAFGDYTKWRNSISNNVITIEYIGSEEIIPEPAISYDAGSTGIIMQQEKIDSYSNYRRYFESDDLSNWSNNSYWKKVSGWLGYSGLKGFYELLLENIPNIIIICCAFPCYGLVEGQFKTMKDFYLSDFYKNNRNRADTFINAGKYYNIKVIDVEKLCNLTLQNWFEFNPPGDVHPNNKGYIRWADTVIKELI